MTSPALTERQPVAVAGFHQHVVDYLGITTAERRSMLQYLAGQFEARMGSRVAALIVKSALPETPEQLASRVARSWQIDDGALLLVAWEERAVRIENGGRRGITDTQAKAIAIEVVGPMFDMANADYSVELGLRAIMEMLEKGPEASVRIIPQERIVVLDPPAQEPASRRLLGAAVIAPLALALAWAWWRHRRRLLAAGRTSLPSAREASDASSSAGSPLGIIVINCIPLWGVLVEGWDVSALLVLFCAEILIAGLMTGLRVAIAGQPGLAVNVWLRDGIFGIAYSFGITALLRPQYLHQIERDPLQGSMKVLEELHVWPQIAVLAAVEAVLFLKSILRREHVTADVRPLAYQGFLRLVALHVGLFFGAILSNALGSPAWALLALVLLKTWLEVWLHLYPLQVR